MGYLPVISLRLALYGYTVITEKKGRSLVGMCERVAYLVTEKLRRRRLRYQS